MKNPSILQVTWEHQNQIAFQGFSVKITTKFFLPAIKVFKIIFCVFFLRFGKYLCFPDLIPKQ